MASHRPSALRYAPRGHVARRRRTARRGHVVKGTYAVIASRIVNAKVKGERLELEMTEGAERSLIQAGHIKRVEPESEVKTEKRAMKAPMKKGATSVQADS